MQPEEKYLLSVDALREFVCAAGFSDVVIGLSGGMDSSLVAVMCVDAFGADHVHGVLLPGPYSSESSLTDALDLASVLGVATQTISITQPFRAFAGVLSAACEGSLAGLAAENTQARCRMVCLMALSNTHGWLLINTSNKSEAMMGYSTLYGDTAGAFAPLGGLYKTDVYAAARWRNEAAVQRNECAPIPENVFAKPPSAELSPDQEDEKSLGIDYATLDKILIAVFEQGRTPEALVEEGFEAEQVARIVATAQSFAYKRALEPPYPPMSFYESRIAGVRVRTFGAFDVFVDGVPLEFHSSKAKELMALLVDRRGGFLSTDEAFATIRGDKAASDAALSLCRKAFGRLQGVLDEAGVGDMLIVSREGRRLDTAKFTCDYYRFLKGDKTARAEFCDEYMTQYSWGEPTKAALIRQAKAE
ncbi:MAG: NAD(+) synthase [Raoultibacter sp.]